jgi:hypothetical protein
MIRTLLRASIAAAALAVVTASLPAHAGNDEAMAGEDNNAGDVIRVDWQDPALLPSRFRNHCVAQRWSGRLYCEDHCGRGYEFYYCTTASFGCCRVGYGYCDHHGHLRCHP